MAVIRKKNVRPAAEKTSTEKTAEGKAAVKRENQLLQQIDEFRAKAKELQEMLEAREEEVAELEELVAVRDREAKHLDELVTSRREEADQLVIGVTIQIQEMIQQLDQQMTDFDISVRRLLSEFSNKLEEEISGSEERTQAQITALDEAIEKEFTRMDGQIGERLTKIDETTETQLRHTGEQIDRQLGSLNEQIGGELDSLKTQVDTQLGGLGGQIDAQLKALDESLTGQIGESLARTEGQAQEIQSIIEELRSDQENLKKDLYDKIHTEDVKCYRNVKDLLDKQSGELAAKCDEVKLAEESLTAIRRSFRGLKFMAFFAVIDLAAIAAGFLLLFMGL